MIVSLVIVLVLFGAAIMFALWRILSRHATTATAHLQDMTQEYLLKEEELKQRLDSMDKSYQEQIVKARLESDQIRAKAVQEAETSKQRLLLQGREEAERMTQKAVETRDAMMREIDQLADQKAIVRACDFVKTLLPEVFRKSVHEAWVDNLLDEGLIDMSQFPASEQKADAVQVASAFALTEVQRKRIAEKLVSVLGKKVSLQESVVPELVSGLTVTVGSVILDGSLAGRLKEAERNARASSE